jgi:hypothetical protein
MNVTSHRARLVAVAAGLIALTVPLAAHGSRTADPSLTLNVNLSGALEVVLGNGTRIRTASAPGTVIPPGPYLLIVKSDVPDEKDDYHLFHLSGAGVDMSSDLLPCENPREIYTINLRPNSTYVYEDGRHPELPKVVFTTSGSGSSADTSSTATVHSAGGYLGSVSNSELLGSKAVRGTLSGKVTAVGLTLSAKGKAVSMIKSGRYRVTVDDRTSKLGFTIAKAQKTAVPVTRAPYVGKHTVTLNLTPGRWTFWSAPGAKHSFTVVS